VARERIAIDGRNWFNHYSDGDLMKKIRTLMAIAILLAPLEGCSRTLQELRATGEVVQFETNEPYQSVYRKIIDQARECYQFGLSTAHLAVQGDLYTDMKSGTVTVVLMNRITGDIANECSAEISEIADNRTRVIIHYAKHRYMAENMRNWVKFGSTNCGH
jgi:hypothetical protein